MHVHGLYFNVMRWRRPTRRNVANGRDNGWSRHGAPGGTLPGVDPGREGNWLFMHHSVPRSPS